VFDIQDGSVDKSAVIDGAITKLSADIERMAPNMKAMERYGVLSQVNILLLIEFLQAR
jgi:hypothetical protein